MLTQLIETDLQMNLDIECILVKRTSLLTFEIKVFVGLIPPVPEVLWRKSTTLKGFKRGADPFTVTG